MRGYESLSLGKQIEREIAKSVSLLQLNLLN